MNIRPTLTKITRNPFLHGLLLLFFISCAGCGGPDKTEVLNIRLEGAPNNLNPFLTSSGYNLYVCNQMFQTLGNLDPKTLEMKPLLAKSIPEVRNVTEGPYKGSLAYDFEIQEAAKWDNGTPVTAQDILFTMKLMFHPGLPTQNWATYYQALQNIEVDPANPKKFTAYYKEYYMLALESMCQFFVYPAYNYDPNNRLTNIPLTRFLDKSKAAELTADINVKIFTDEFSQPKFAYEPASVTGSGPYRLESLNDQSAVLVKKTGWWGDEAAAETPLLAVYPEKLVYKVVKDEPLTENMLRNGELDIVTGLDAARFVQLKSDATLTSKYDFITNGSIQYARWMFNLRNPKLADARVRRALAQVIDYDYALKTVLQGMAQPIVGPVNPAKSYYAGNIKPYTMNIAAARQLLAEAGWADSNNDGIVDKMINNRRTDLSIDVLVPISNKINSALAASLSETALQAGVKINVIGVDFNKISNDTKEGKYESAFLGAQLFPGLVELYSRFHSASLTPAGDNRSGFANARADSLIMAIRTTPDEAVRKALYLQAQQILHDEVPEVPLFAPLQRIIVANKFDYVLTANRPGYYEQMFKLK
ncbi:MAG TPA: ABC transporter substrate-binding protein [Saprospiraceae bacterium]|nr:ABC transporter substrate-binding protein [Saprospiraceae bacterium]